MSTDREFVNLRFWSLFILAVLVTILGQAIHENGHSLVYQVMGRKPVWGFTKIVQVWETPPLHPEEWTETSFEGEIGWLKLRSLPESQIEKAVGIAAGPMAGLTAAVLGLVVMKKAQGAALKQIGLALTVSLSLSAVLYYLRSASRVGGDEYNLAQILRIPPASLNILFGLGFGLCLLFAVQAMGTWRTAGRWLGTVLLGSAAAGALLFFADSYLISQVNAGNSWFRPVLGVAFPVLLVNLLALASIWIWHDKHQRDSWRLGKNHEE